MVEMLGILFTHEIIKRIQEKGSEIWKIEIEKAKFEMTDFGKIFIDVYINDMV